MKNGKLKKIHFKMMGTRQPLKADLGESGYGPVGIEGGSRD
ncbi:hypothetical protein [Levilactobacillus suantsaii]|nr:hypothetical protein [Levilactobacillus suantsaii]